MSEQYLFAVRAGKLKGGTRAAAKRHRIARQTEEGAGYTYYFDDDCGVWRGWGYCPNLGHPFDSQTARKIMAAWAAAGVG